MLTVVTWKWGSLFSPEYVNNLRAMLARHLHVDHRLVCIADTDKGIGPGVEVLPMYTEHADMTAGSRACFRRLRMFDPGMREVLGPRFLHLDLDVVIVGDITNLVIKTEPILIYDQNAGTGAKKVAYNPSVLLMDAGAAPEIWTDFHADPQGVWKKAKGAGFSCSDMSVIGLYLDKIKPPTLGPKDGLVAYWRDVKPKGRLPEHARAVLFYGNDNPHDPKVMAKNPWIRQHWGAGGKASGEPLVCGTSEAGSTPAPPSKCCDGKRRHRPGCTVHRPGEAVSNSSDI